MTDQALALSALKRANFDWAMHVKRVWEDTGYDVEAHHQQERAKILDRLLALKQSSGLASPLGIVIVGQAGSGKTHLLSTIRKHAQNNGLNFVLVDMTDVRDFWETVLQGYISSLQEAGADGVPQLEVLGDRLIAFTGKSFSAKQLAQSPAKTLRNAMAFILKQLAGRDRQQTLQHQDVIRALILLNANDFTLSGIGYTWLQGLEIEPKYKAYFGFTTSTAIQLSRIVAGLSWAMNLAAPTVLALDQLDAIVTQHHLAAGKAVDSELTDEQRLSRSIIEGIGGGLMALRDETCRTMTVLSCLQATWEVLQQEVVKSFRDRFEKEIVLERVVDEDVAKDLIRLRLEEAYQQEKFVPPYATWPFSNQFFHEMRERYPRRILQVCNEHRDWCINKGEVVELETTEDAQAVQTTALSSQLDQELASLQSLVELMPILEEQNEDSHLGILLEVACNCLQIEHPTAPNIDTVVESKFSGGKNYPVLHTRIRLIFREENDREKHLCLRALQRSHATAFQTRLKAAMTMAGIDRALSFRKLAIVRTHKLPRGAKTQQLIQNFRSAGGVFLAPTEDELRQLGALQQLTQQQHPEFKQWLRDRRPVSQLPFMQQVANWLFDGIASPEEAVEQTHPQESHSEPISSEPQINIPSKDDETTTNFPHTNGSSGASGTRPDPQPTVVPPLSPRPAPRVLPGQLPIGARLVGQQTREIISVPLEDLTKHTVILAGSGSGKTVLVKRLVEEAAIQGIPAIVIDGANDLSRMGDRWPQIPESWSEADRHQADLYHRSTDVVIWTPGREAGNPLNLEPMPDFGAIAHDADELEQAIDMTRDSLQDVVAAGKSTTAKIKQGILRKALEYFAHSGGGSLEDFASLLSDLPPDAAEGIAKAQKLAPEMSDLLMAEIANNPLLRQSGAAMDPAMLFGIDRLGIDRPSSQTRISIINLVGLVGLSAQQQFLNQLAMTLFTWIKKNPAPQGVLLRGLVVIDEAKDFVPSASSTPCKASLNRLAAQARKYGLGLIFATQAPKSIDHNIIANCSIQFYGRANSPAAIDVIKQQLMQRGGNGQDIPRLSRGQFYAVSEALPTSIKIQSPLCLSYHPSSPPDELEVLALAKASREAIASPAEE